MAATGDGRCLDGDAGDGPGDCGKLMRRLSPFKLRLFISRTKSCDVLRGVLLLLLIVSVLMIRSDARDDVRF